MFLPSLLDGGVTFQESPVLRPERSVAISARSIDSLLRLEEVPHVMLVSKALDRFGFLYPPLVFNDTGLLLDLSFDVLVFLPLLLRSNVILPHAEGFSLGFKELLNLPIVLVKPVLVLA